MQDLYFEQSREKLLHFITSREQQFFTAFIKNVDIEYLKTIPYFNQLAKKALAEIPFELLCLIAFNCVQHNNLGAIRYLVEE